jgi:hypothetical protein
MYQRIAIIAFSSYESIDYYNFQLNSLSHSQDIVTLSGSKNEPFVLLEKKKAIASSIAIGFCQSMRPRNIFEDEDFINIIQQCFTGNGDESSHRSAYSL